PPELYPLSLHDALPIFHSDAHEVTARPRVHAHLVPRAFDPLDPVDVQEHEPLAVADDEPRGARRRRRRACRRAERLQQRLEPTRSEEHTSELQSPYDLV